MAKPGSGWIWITIILALLVMPRLFLRIMGRQPSSPIHVATVVPAASPAVLSDAENQKSQSDDGNSTRTVITNNPTNKLTAALNPVSGAFRVGVVKIPVIYLYVFVWFLISAGIARNNAKRHYYYNQKKNFRIGWAGLFGAGVIPVVLGIKLLPGSLGIFTLACSVVTGISLYLTIRSSADKNSRSVFLDLIATVAAAFYGLAGCAYVLGIAKLRERFTDPTFMLLAVLSVSAGLTGTGGLIKFFFTTESRRTQKLLKALAMGDLVKIQGILRKNVNVDFRNPETNIWILIDAVMKNQAAIAEVLLAKGAFPDQLDSNGNSALIIAAEAGSSDLVRLLIKYRANVNRRNLKGRTALIAAANKGNTEVVELLLGAGADPNLAQQEVSPLISAAYNGHLEVVRLLLERGVDVNARNSYGISALIWASEKGYTDIVKLLLDRGADVHQKPAASGTALMQAAGYGHHDIVEILLNHGALLEDQDCNGQTPLIRAAHFGHADIVKLFITRGAEKWQVANNQWNALMYALKGGYERIANMLLEGEPEQKLESVDFDLYKDNQEAETAVLTLAKINHPKREDMLCRFLEKPAEIRWAVARALGEIADEQAIDALLAAYHNENNQDRDKMLEIIRPISDPRIETLVREEDELKKKEREKQLIKDTEHYLSQLSNYHTISQRQQAARQLIQMFENGELPDKAKQKIISVKSVIEMPHQDGRAVQSHSDKVGFHEDVRVPSNDCSDGYHADEFKVNYSGRHYDNTNYRHEDEGIGVPFPNHSTR